MHWRSKLIHPGTHAPGNFRSLTTPTYRGSTVLFERQADVSDDWRQTENGYTYGLYGTPTVLELGARIAEIEGAHHSFVVPGGQAAISLIYLAFCKTGAHALVPFTAYGPNRELAAGLLRDLGITVEAYDPLIGAGIAKLIRDNTALIWVESPGSVTMEVQDVPAIVAAAHARKVPVALDNTYAAGVLFDAFAHGVDVSMQALTKSVVDATAYEAIGAAYKQLGMAVSPDDCSLALRGLKTLGVRLERLEKTALELAQWLADHPHISTVLHPALPSCPGHEHWRRDFTGSSSIFSVVFQERFTALQVAAFADRLRLFKIGFSWGGVTSLVVVYPNLQRPGKSYGGRLVRLNVGLEEPSDLLADLAQALSAMDDAD